MTVQLFCLTIPPRSVDMKQVSGMYLLYIVIYILQYFPISSESQFCPLVDTNFLYVLVLKDIWEGSFTAPIDTTYRSAVLSVSEW